jgi:hypothetical protein
MLDPANRWQPVTSEYQEELTPRRRRPLRDRLWKRKAVKAAQGAEGAPAAVEEKVPAGIVGITWFYLLSAGAYFVSGSVLLSFPLSDFGYNVMRHAHVIVPFPVRQLENVPVVNVLAESLFIMAGVSAVIAVLWMIGARSARWVTLCYAGARLVRNVLYLFAGPMGLRVPLLPAGARELLLLDSLADAFILCYLILSLRAASVD